MALARKLPSITAARTAGSRRSTGRLQTPYGEGAQRARCRQMREHNERTSATARYRYLIGVFYDRGVVRLTNVTADPGRWGSSAACRGAASPRRSNPYDSPAKPPTLQ